MQERGVDFEERAVDDRREWMEIVIEVSGQNTVPVLVYPDGRVEVGFEGERG